MEEDLVALGIEEAETMDRDVWKCIIYYRPPSFKNEYWKT